jgi:hypothetical protein
MPSNNLGAFKLAAAVVVVLGSALALLAVTATRAQQQSPAQAACILKVNKAVRGVAKAEGRLVGSCLKETSRSQPDLFDDCIAQDLRQKVEAARAKTALAIASYCSPPPSYGFTDANTANDAAVAQEVGLLADIFGEDYAAAVISSNGDPTGARCQAAVQKSYEKILQAQIRTFESCKKTGLKSGSIDSEAALAACFDAVTADTRGRIGKGVVKLADALATSCGGVVLGDAFPGGCSSPGFPACVEQKSACRTCLMITEVDGLDVQCDMADNGVADASCVDPRRCGDGVLDAGEQCDDGNGVNGDCCSSTCTAEPNGQACNDLAFCNGADTCSGGTCSAHAGSPCPGADGDGNCAESCSEIGDNCTAPDPNGSLCTDGTFCDGPDTCSAGACSTHAGNPCVGPDGDGNCSETCNEATDNCTAPDPDGTACNDALFCNGTDTCSAGACSVHSGSPCAGPDGDNNCSESCNETNDSCTAADPNGSACSDNVFCNGADTCSTGTCSGHAGNPCNGPDGDSDCSETCDESADDCAANDPNGTACDDGIFCNGTDSCFAGACTLHSGNPCPGADGDGDCSEVCDETADACSGNDPNGSACDDGLFCNGTDTCASGNCSSHTGNPCPGADGDADCSETCDEAVNDCTGNDPNGSTCTDGLFCNGVDTCLAGACTVHPGNPCPGPDGDSNCAESCNEAGQNCAATDPNGSACSDGLFCNGADTCSSGACTGHAGNPCPGADGDGNCSETCNESADNCSAADPNGSACDNGLGCDGADSCSSGTCVPSGVCCGTVDFTFNVESSAGGAFSSAQWPGGQQTQNGISGCSVTINNPNNNIDQVCTLGAPFSVAGFAGFSSCFGTGGEDGDGCQPVDCPPAGIGSCCSTRPSCSAALNGRGHARYFVHCVDP